MPAGLSGKLGGPDAVPHGFCNISGSLVTFAAIRLASSFLVSNFCRRSPAGLLLEIDKCELLARFVFDDKAGLQFLDGPRRREGAGGQFSGSV
jgi:hypothetical protein